MMTGFRPQERDRLIVRDLLFHGIATRDQLMKLGHFASIPRCNFRLGQLMNVGWVRRVSSVNGLALQQSIYAPGPAAIPLLEKLTNLEPHLIAAHCRSDRGPQAVEHSLSVLDFRLQLQTDCLSRGVNVEEWLSEPECFHEFRYRPYPSAAWISTAIKPDGFAQLTGLFGSIAAFVEMDLGNVSLPRYQAKLNRYDRYHASGAFQDVYETTGFALLTVTTGERRLGHLMKLPCQFPHVGSTQARINDEGVFNCTWQTCSDTGPLLRLLETLRGRQ